jgi:sialidase-1
MATRMITRRHFIRTATLALPCLAYGALPAGEVSDPRVISWEARYYHGWPTVARRRNGQLWLAWSGGRESHVCPFGQVHAMTSDDDGATWTWPRVLLDSATDDRDAGVLETTQGTLLVTSFTSLAYQPRLTKALQAAAGAKGAMPPEQLARWKAVHSRLGDTAREADLGEWLIRSTDGGKSWSPRLPTMVNSPHGPIQLRDGRLLYAGKQLWTADKKIGVAESQDDGLTWQWLADLPARTGDTPAGDYHELYHELHAVEAADGTLIVHIRNHSAMNTGETLQTESRDGGRTWSEPHAIGVWGLPSHLLRLRDGRLLMGYGYRRAPFGNQARLSTDHGKTWGEAISLSADGIGGDLGYPSTVELADGSLLTVWYEQMRESTQAVLRQVRWKVG